MCQNIYIYILYTEQNAGKNGAKLRLFSAPLSETGASDFIPEYWQKRTIIIIIAKSANIHRKSLCVELLPLGQSF